MLTSAVDLEGLLARSRVKKWSGRQVDDAVQRRSGCERLVRGIVEHNLGEGRFIMCTRRWHLLYEWPEVGESGTILFYQ
jgi:hypothetical protein